MNRRVAVIGFAQSPCLSEAGTTSGVETLVPVLRDALAGAGLHRREVDFWCSGSSDYLAGRAFSFVNAVDAIGAFPPICESHVEMDAAWAFYEAYVKILAGEAETALVYGFGKSSAGRLRRVLALQLDPYATAPLWPDSVSIAALQARLALDAGILSERDMAEVAVRSRADAATNPYAQVAGETTAERLLAEPYLADPLRVHDCAPVGDGAAALVLAADDRARRQHERPAWITGAAHRIDPQTLGERDLTAVPSATAAAAAAELPADLDAAELHAPFTHQELLLRTALGLGDGVRINPSGGALCGNPMFSAGLNRIGAAATLVMSGQAGRVAAHATSGPALQQNLVCVLEAGR
ncbi:thiolase domain-containing protein [Couchioplanes caeruleus]|uniref:Lipid-transfer protein n=2 Tax=Couchioplanes caeruleus TaxID=56438 RepID=A0A1K0GKW9_9ACTN|nr:thiolase domain-containing protein [Couchioplanes caeruleus]OJF12934.1 lipid-transfer protein [Couchioplanes caeruleus subsp. caeruleus]ROP28041.1 acetyl-CoA acetyltransferase [Couchioplanes caeruleus]